MFKTCRNFACPQREVTTAVRTISTVTRATIDESSEPSVEMDRLCPNGLDAAMGNKAGGGLGSFRWVVVDLLLILLVGCGSSKVTQYRKEVVPSAQKSEAKKCEK